VTRTRCFTAKLSDRSTKRYYMYDLYWLGIWHEKESMCS